MNFSRLTCANCGPESLHKFTTCVRCGAVYQAGHVGKVTAYVFSIRPGAADLRPPKNQVAAIRKHTGRPRKTPELGELRKLVTSGATNEQIAKRYGVAEDTARRWLRESGIARTHNAHAKPCPDVKKLRALVADGFGLHAIAGEFRAAPCTVARWLDAESLEMSARPGPKPKSKVVPRESNSQEPATC